MDISAQDKESLALMAKYRRKDGGAAGDIPPSIICRVPVDSPAHSIVKALLGHSDVSEEAREYARRLCALHGA